MAGICLLDVLPRVLRGPPLLQLRRLFVRTRFGQSERRRSGPSGASALSNISRFDLVGSVPAYLFMGNRSRVLPLSAVGLHCSCSRGIGSDELLRTEVHASVFTRSFLAATSVRSSFLLRGGACSSLLLMLRLPPVYASVGFEGSPRDGRTLCKPLLAVLSLDATSARQLPPLAGEGRRRLPEKDAAAAA